MEDRALYEVLEPEIEENNDFTIDNDSKAEWALSIIKAEKADRDRLIAVCEEKIKEYQEKIEQFKKRFENRTSYLVSLLNQYFQTVPKKKTKTQETYKLPSGTLKLKLPSIEYQRDDAKLVEWLKSSGMNEFIQVKEAPKWAELKKRVIVSGDKVITEDGEIVEGIAVVEKPARFEVEV